MRVLQRLLRSRSSCSASQQSLPPRSVWQQCNTVLTAVVCRLPGQKARLLLLLTMLGQTAALNGLLVILPMVEQIDGILAGVACPFHKRIQQKGFLDQGRLLIAWSQIP